MRKVFLKLALMFLLIPLSVYSEEYVYILNDKCINELFVLAQNDFQGSEVEVLRDSRGIILRYMVKDVTKEYKELKFDVYRKIEYFLAKIENPAIIEVHIGDFSEEKFLKLKKWEISTVIANNIESIITKPVGTIEQDKINSIGYGEFLPEKNTPNNGGKSSNRVDIIILCNISGE